MKTLTRTVKYTFGTSFMELILTISYSFQLLTDDTIHKELHLRFDMKDFLVRVLPKYDFEKACYNTLIWIFGDRYRLFQPSFLSFLSFLQKAYLPSWVQTELVLKHLHLLLRHSLLQLEEIISTRAKGAGKLSVIMSINKLCENSWQQFTRDGTNCNGRYVTRNNTNKVWTEAWMNERMLVHLCPFSTHKS